MSSVTTDSLGATEVAEHSLLPVPDSARTSTAGHQFWIWAGANTAPINWVLGALGVQIGLGLWQTVAVLVLGNLLGMGVFGLFALMGQRTGVSQMVLSRVAFGRRGAYLPALLQGLLAVGWCAVNTWIVLDLVMALLDRLGVSGSTGLKVVVAVVIMLAQVFIAAIGFRAIARFERWTVPVTLAVLLAMTVVAWTTSGVDWGFTGKGLHGAALWSALSTIMTAIGIGWGITWFAYASDYSRFVPRSMPAGKLYLASFLGQFLPTVWLGIFGATLATVARDVDPGQLVVQNFGALAIPVILLVIHGPIATNVLNIYSCALCAQTLDWKIDRRVLSYVVGALALAFTIYLVLRGEFASALDGWLAGLVTWVAPWGTIVLINYYRVQRRQVDVAALFDAPGASGHELGASGHELGAGQGRGPRLVDVSWPALVAFVVGMVATWSAEYGIPTWLQGPLARAMGGVDLSWLVGSVVAGVVYVLLRPRPTALPDSSGSAGSRRGSSDTSRAVA